MMGKERRAEHLSYMNGLPPGFLHQATCQLLIKEQKFLNARTDAAGHSYSLRAVRRYVSPSGATVAHGYCTFQAEACTFGSEMRSSEDCYSTLATTCYQHQALQT